MTLIILATKWRLIIRHARHATWPKVSSAHRVIILVHRPRVFGIILSTTHHTWIRCCLRLLSFISGITCVSLRPLLISSTILTLHLWSSRQKSSSRWSLPLGYRRGCLCLGKNSTPLLIFVFLRMSLRIGCLITTTPLLRNCTWFVEVCECFDQTL